MKVLTGQELERSGISLSEAQRSLTLNYLNKKFVRKSDVPKKFKDKALNICYQIFEMGKESFLTETNYSYTIWEEDQKSVEASQNKNNRTTSSQSNSIKNNKSFSSSPYSLKNFMNQTEE